MAKNTINKAKSAWSNFFSEEKKKNRDLILYGLGVLLLGVILFEGFYLWNVKDNSFAVPAKETADSSSREKNGMIVGEAQKEGGKSDYGTNDSGFESAIYRSPKMMLSKNVNVELSKDQFHFGRASLKLDWLNGEDRSVRLNSYLLAQKDKYYKLGLWVSGSENGHFQISLENQDGSFPIADMGVVANEPNKFRYYEYNFRSPADASDLKFSAGGTDPSVIFIDDIKLLPLDLNDDGQLASIKATAVGSSQPVRGGEKQLNHSENSDALSVPKTLLGQVFAPQGENLAGSSFFMVKKGNGGEGEYSLEVREFDEKKNVISPEKLAVRNFSAKDINSEITFIPIAAKLETGKKYWLGFNNSTAKVSPENYLAIGQSGDNSAYPDGSIFLQKGVNKFFTEEKDLDFYNSYIDPLNQEGATFSYGETLYDLGQGKTRLDYQLDQANGSNVLEIHAQNGLLIDKTRNIFLKDGDSYLDYKIGTNGKKVEKFILNDLVFNNNIQVSISTDGNNWTEIYSDNSGKFGQHSGRIEVGFTKEVKDIFIRLKKNGDAKASFVGGYAILELAE